MPWTATGDSSVTVTFRVPLVIPMKASRIDKLMFELHQKKNLPEKKANRINKLMYGLHKRKDPKKTNSVQASKKPLIICISINKYRVHTSSYDMVSHARNIP